MREAIGDLWSYPADARCVTTCGVVRANCELVMGKGVALQAAQRYKSLPFLAGEKVKTWGNHLFVFELTGHKTTIITFPTKHHWRDRSSLSLIEASAKRLVKAAEHFKWQVVVLTRPGCGNGGLRWEAVKEVIAPILVGDRFVILTPP